MERTDPMWSLVTVTHNSAATLRRFWSGVGLGGGVEWVVVDNASADVSRDVARRLGANVIGLGKNVGFAAANNVGLHASRGEFVAFVNPDVTPHLPDLPALRRELEATPRALVAPQLVNHDGTPQPNGRGVPYLTYKVLHRVSPARVHARYRRFATPGQVVAVDWLMGAAVAGTRAWLEHLGPWDERYFLYYEDSDLGLRNQRLGGTSKVVGDARWLHGWSRDTARLSARAWRRELGSMVRFYAAYPRLIVHPLGRDADAEVVP